MKRVRISLDIELLEQAMRLTGRTTRSATMDLALRELVRRSGARRILALRGSGAWHGELSEMRRDAPVDGDPR